MFEETSRPQPEKITLLLIKSTGENNNIRSPLLQFLEHEGEGAGLEHKKVIIYIEFTSVTNFTSV